MSQPVVAVEPKTAAGLIPAAAILAAVLFFFVALLSLNPFQWVRQGIIRCFSGSAKAKVERFWQDPHTQEVSTGESPKANLDSLATYWGGLGSARRVVLIGNSQTFSVILAPDETLKPAEEKTYPDLVFERLAQSSPKIHGYRLSAPNISYMEALWYVRYLLTRPELKPNRLVVQLNFETLRKTGVREGMLDLLQNDAFASAIREESRAPGAYAATLHEAVERYERRSAAAGAKSEVGASKQTSRTGILESFGFGAQVERNTRGLLSRVPLWDTRHNVKATFLDTLYLMRVHILQITPTTKRSIGGPTLEANRSALERIGQLCRDNAIEFVLFDAPQNPKVPLFRTQADRTLYRDITTALAARYASGFYDFSDSVPQKFWGEWVDGPDPIHFGRAGHQLMATIMMDRGVFR